MFRLIRRALLGAVVAGGLLLVPGESQQVQADEYWSNYWNWYDGSYRPYYRNQYRNYGHDRDYGYRSYYGNRGYRDYDDYGYSIGVPGANYQRYPRSTYQDRYWSQPRSSYQLGPLRVERWY
jgi:hypothetical protein